MKTATIYCRVSTEGQEREGTSLDSQREACLRKAQELGYEVSHTFKETYTGLVLDRPQLNQLRQLVRDKQVDAVIAYTLDRLSRDPVYFIILQEELERAGIKLAFVTEDIDSSDMGKLIAHIKGYAAKLEALKIRDRCLRGLKERAKTGRLVGGRSVHLLGYDYDGSQGKRVINERTSELVMDIFKWATEGYTEHGIAYHLTEMGILTRTGKSRWSPSTIHKILTNAAYIGKPKPYHGIEIGNSTPALISEGLFNQVQANLNSHRQTASRNAKVKYLLRGHIYCSKCHRKYYASTWHKTPWYYCSGRLRILTSHKCENKTYQADYLEGLVWEQVRELLNTPEIILDELKRRKQETNEANLTKELTAIEKRLVALDEQQGELLSWALRGFPEQTVIKENIKINQYRDTLKSRLSELSGRIAEVKQNELDLSRVKHFCEIASKNLANFTYTEKRLALEALRVEVWIEDRHISITGAVPIYDIATTQLKPGRWEW